jgi:mannose-6-phosphate isomerase-like protein (cupin superfamily)
MSDVIVKQLEEVDPYSGVHAIPGIRFRPAGRAMGVSAWGMNVIELDPGCERYLEHDHAKDGQEEVYVILRGSATLRSEAKEWQVPVGALVRVGPLTKRKFIPGPQGVTLLAIGGTPGKAYEPRR